jgi:hypothetical protein
LSGTLLANAPHAPRYRPGLRAARALPGVRECCGSDADADADATAADKSDAASNRLAIRADERPSVAVSESFRQSFRQSWGVAVRVSVAERLARFTEPVVLAAARAVGIPIARSQSVAGGARSRPRA